jgi:hypothetical protein
MNIVIRVDEHLNASIPLLIALDNDIPTPLVVVVFCFV